MALAGMSGAVKRRVLAWTEMFWYVWTTAACNNGYLRNVHNS